MDTHPITREGYDNLLKEYERLKKVELPAIIIKIAEARSHGDLKENAEYHSAREHQSYIQSRLHFLEDSIAGSRIVKVDTSQTDRIIFGCRVSIEDLEDATREEFTLVGPAEGDPAKGKISTASPIGKSLLGKRVNDIVEVETPGGLLKLKILSFS